MGFASVINYFLSHSNEYNGSGVQPLGDRFIMTEAERAASRKDVAAFMSDNDAMQKYSVFKSATTSTSNE